ncbi:MAG: iron-containing alcohol dehydrogenase family protein [Lachnospiraceae bacterium]|nr:iron-containing alcohol dehydrogenase family protein [Lachnospiraceae bacterium]
MSKTIQLPRFTIGTDAFDRFKTEMGRFGSRVFIIHGEKSWKAAEKYVMPALEKAGLTVIGSALYGHEATFEKAKSLAEDPMMQKADMVLAVGGGKCTDTAKYAADLLNLPVFAVPTIASNCASVSQISVMYEENGVYAATPVLKAPPVHSFIHPGIILEAPIQYLWAGIGDAMAKHVESHWSAEAGETLDYGSRLGITAGTMCFDPMAEDGRKALEDAKNGQVSPELERTILGVIVSPGITSVSVDAAYNGGVAHALYYGLTCRKHIEKNHLHGEVVSYGTLVNLMLDGDKERFEKAYAFNRSVGLPTALKDLELSPDDPLDDVLEITMRNQELIHVPYPVSKESIRDAILKLEKVGEQ